MDLGIAGRIAFVAASSQGLGFACAASLAREGVQVTLNGRSSARLGHAAARLSAEVPGASVATIAADLTTKAGRDAIVAALPTVDILITNNAGPAPGHFEDWGEEEVLDALRLNMVPAFELTRAYLPGMRKQGFGRIVNITSAMVKSPAPEMGLSASARAALTAMSKAISRDVAADGVTINNLLPERIDSPRQDFMVERRARADGVNAEEARRRIASTIAVKRLGRPDEVGDTCAFLCSVRAGYMTGQNIQLDGGTYPGLI